MKCNKLTNAATIIRRLQTVTALPNHIVFLECHRWPRDHHATLAVTTPEHELPHAKIDPHRAMQNGRFRPGCGFVSADHLPPTSPARTSRALECGPTKSGCVRSLRRRAAWRATPSGAAAPRRTGCGGVHTPTSCRSPTACPQRLEGLRPELPIFCHQMLAAVQARP